MEEMMLALCICISVLTIAVFLGAERIANAIEDNNKNKEK